MSGTGAEAVGVTAESVAAFERVVAEGGVAVFPADTVYGLATDPESESGVRRLYELKRRPPMPSATMFFSLVAALDAFPELGPRTRAAFEALLPGPFMLVVANAAGRFPLAGGPAGSDRIGVRVPMLDGVLAPLAAVERPALQSSANLHGGPDPRRLGDVPGSIRAGADLVLDAGELPGVASTVVDLSRYDADGEYAVLREGAVAAAELARRLVDIR